VATLAVVALIVVSAPLLGRLTTGPGASPSATPPPAGESPSEAPASPAPSGPPALSDQVARRIGLDHIPTAVGFAFDSLWVTDTGGDLLRINPASGETIATIPLDAPGCGPIQADAFSVWLRACGVKSTVDPGAASTIRVDPTANAIADHYADEPPDGAGIGAIRGQVWFASGVTTLTAVSADTGEPVRTIELAAPVLHVTAGLGSLWVTPIGTPAVVRIDPETGDELARISLSGDSGYLTASGDAIWVAEPFQWLLGKIDPVANALAFESGAAPGADQIVIDANGEVWVLTHERLIGYDGATGRILHQFAVPLHDTLAGVESLVLAADDDGLWYGAPDALWFIPTE
jgi:streptogramin lyase